MTVAIVLVSHSSLVAEGTKDLAGQMAPDVTILAAGGRADGGLGTDYARIETACSEADSAAGTVIIADLGSAVMTAESVLELSDSPERFVIADAAFIEGAVAAAVAAQTGGDLAAVVAAAESSLRHDAASGDDGPGAVDGDVDARGAAAGVSGNSIDVVLVNPEGLHARPAADFVRLASTFDADITVNGVDARSLLGIMALGLTQGRTVTISATGAEASQARAALS
ncbi:MAG: dihydroxyacetone kinase phosphoryl donor subunit DhaM, partial [Mycetocola sp.]